jgi:hypothetical protein
MGSRGAEVKKTFRARTTAKEKLEKKQQRKYHVNTQYS